MILFGNEALLAGPESTSFHQTGMTSFQTASALTGDGKYGWTMPAAQTGGSGGLMSHWLVFFLQAGGELFGPNGRPMFVTDAGVAAIDMLKQLLAYSDPGRFGTRASSTHLRSSCVEKRR